MNQSSQISWFGSVSGKYSFCNIILGVVIEATVFGGFSIGNIEVLEGQFNT